MTASSLYCLLPGYPLTPLVGDNFLYLRSSSGFIPYALNILPSNYATPINLAPFSMKNLDAQYPTLPKPWTMKVFPASPGATPNLEAIWLFYKIFFVT